MNDDRINLTMICDRTGLPLRTLKYVLDQGIIDPDRFARREYAQMGRGNARVFSPYAAFAVALTATVYSCGIKRGPVKVITDRFFKLVGTKGRKKSSLDLDAFLTWERARGIVMEIGDGRFLNVIEAPQGGKVQASGWVEIESGRGASRDFAPVVTIRIDVGELASRVSGGNLPA